MKPISSAAIAAEALGLPESEREAFLERSCGGDAEQLASARLILAARRAAAQFDPSMARRAGDDVAARAGTPEADATSSVSIPAADSPTGSESIDGESEHGLDAATLVEAPGARIGPYLLRRVLGEGGFGRVFLADQERPVRRQVALKIIRLGMDTRTVIARFEAERQALALMDHPGIAKVFDAGSTRTGRPYFVMELVDGIPITRFCDAFRLDVRARVKLFQQVCAAVQHAHRRGVIHRDLKPSNILVTEQDGQAVPKVIDFGIAKATHAQLTDRTIATAKHSFIGTPQYMSPEQADLSAAGEDIDTRSDVYALGVVLYELLTSTTPLAAHRLDRLDLTQMQRMIREEPAQRPSSRLTCEGRHLEEIAARRSEQPDRLRRLLRGDLDWIVLKALEKERDRRYESPSALAADLERFTTNQPVEARPPSTVYRLRKFAQRHRGPVIAALAVLATLVLGLVGTSTFAVMAALGARHSREVEVFLTGLFGATSPLSAAGDPERLRGDAQRLFSSDVGMANQILLSFAARLRAGGEPQMAAALLEDLLTRPDGARGKPEEPAARMLLASLYSTLGRHEDAIAQGRLAIALMKEADVRSWQVGLALQQLGGILVAAQQPEAAFLALREAAESMEADPGERAASGMALGAVQSGPIGPGRIGPTPESIAARSEAAAILEAGLEAGIAGSEALPAAERLGFLRTSAEQAEIGHPESLDRFRIERALVGMLHHRRVDNTAQELKRQLEVLVGLSDRLFREDPRSRLDVLLMAIMRLRDAGEMDSAASLVPRALDVAAVLEATDPRRERALSLASAIHNIIGQRTGDPEARVQAIDYLRELRNLLRDALGSTHRRTVEAGLTYAIQLHYGLPEPRTDDAVRELNELLRLIDSAPEAPLQQPALDILSNRAQILSSVARASREPDAVEAADQAYRSLVAARCKVVSEFEAIRDVVAYARWCRELDRLPAARDQLALAVKAGVEAGPSSPLEVSLLECIALLQEIERSSSQPGEDQRQVYIAAARRLAGSRLAGAGGTPRASLDEIRRIFEFLLQLDALEDAAELLDEAGRSQSAAGKPLFGIGIECLSARLAAMRDRCEIAQRTLDTALDRSASAGSDLQTARLMVQIEQVRVLRRCPIDSDSDERIHAGLRHLLLSLSSESQNPGTRELLIEGWLVLDKPP